MSGIRVPDIFNNPSLPVGKSVAEALIANAGIQNWFQAEDEHLTLSGSEIVSFNDRKGTGRALTRASSLKGASLVENLFGSYPGARFNASEQDNHLLNGDPLVLTQPFTWAGVATLRTLAATSNLLGTFTTSAIRAILNVSPTKNAGRLQFLYGSSACVGPVLTLDQPFAFACGFDGTNIFLRVNGETVSVAAAGAPSTSKFAVGALPGQSQFWDGNVAELLLCNVAINTPAGSSVLEDMQGYFSALYGLNL